MERRIGGYAQQRGVPCEVDQRTRHGWRNGSRRKNRDSPERRATDLQGSDLFRGELMRRTGRSGGRVMAPRERLEE